MDFNFLWLVKELPSAIPLFFVPAESIDVQPCLLDDKDVLV